MKIAFDQNTTEIYSQKDRANNVTIDDTIDVRDLQKFIDLYNSDMTLGRISSTIGDNTNLTGDEIEHISQAIVVLEELDESQESTSVVDETPWTEEMERNQHIKISTSLEEALNEIPSRTNVGNIPVGDSITLEKPAKKTRQPKTSTALPGSNKKTLSPQEYIAYMEEKINLTKVISQAMIELQEPDGIELSPKSRQMVIAMEKEINVIVSNYLERIQNL